MADAEIAHVVVQVTIPASATSELAHLVVQVTKPADPVAAELAHLIVQTVGPVVPATSRIYHAIIQVVPSPALALDDLSGLYFLNEDKAFSHDSYYRNTELKIPNPTIKTALLGE